MITPLASVNRWWTRQRWNILIALVAALIVLSLLNVALFVRRSQQTEALGNALDQQRNASSKAGVKPVVPDSKTIKQSPQIIQGDPGPAGPAGPAGRPPTDAEIQKAVARYCGTDQCRGPQGVAGPQPSPAQVAAAVAAFCDANGECRGPSGPTGAPGTPGTPGPKGDQGADGKNGSDGQPGANGVDGKDGATGPQGPGPTDAQVSLAVKNYCDQNNACKGDPGAPGAAGTDGAPGVGIKSIACDRGTQEFVVTYTDGTSEPVEGSDCVAGGGILNPPSNTPTSPGQ